MSHAIFHQSPQESGNLRKNFVRTLIFICASLLLHYLLLETPGRNTWSLEPLKLEQKPLNVRLHAVDKAPIVVEAKAVAARPVSKSSNSRKNTVPPATNHKQDDSVTTTETQDSAPANEIASPIPSSTENQTAPAAEVKALTLPPSAEMKMEVSYTKPNSTPTKGIGEIFWSYNAQSYSASLAVGIDILFTNVNLLKLTSEGKIKENGLVPSLSTDTRRNRSTTAIHFNDEQRTILFSSSNKTVEMEESAQDALSILFQLASIGNSNPQQLAAGNQISFQVAEGRDAQNFVFQVVGEEAIESALVEPDQRLSTVHLIRPPRPGSYNSTLEIWLAPAKSWYPVQIRNTESNGTVTLQKVHHIEIKDRLMQ